MRCFVAVDLDPQLRRTVDKLQAELSGLDTKLIKPENLHFTMKFLGEVDEGTVNKVKIILNDVA
ncbi:MAG: 2'-5' RNA ligase family protein, partial [Candidatus Aenigmatarchaeota archaeon]